PLPSGSKERFPEVTVLVRMQCGIAELAQVLHALEDGHPALFVENLRIVAHPRSSAGADMAGGLDASFELHGHVAPSAGEAADETCPRQAVDMDPEYGRDRPACDPMFAARSGHRIVAGRPGTGAAAPRARCGHHLA